MTQQARQIRFGAVIDRGIAVSRNAWRDQARQIEGLGYDIVLVPDHFEMIDIAPAVALITAAEATTSLRVGSFVYNNDLRHPTLLAKEVATLDLLTDGRSEFGLGAGYLPGDYQKTGITLETPGVRISRMEESIRIIKDFFTEEKVTFLGKYYQVHELQGLPKSVQNPYPPLYIGGGGKRILSIAAREADIVGLTAILKPNGVGFVMTDVTDQATARKVTWIREAAGSRFEHLEINSFVFKVAVTDHPETTASHMAPYLGGLTADQILASPHFLIGNVEQICNQLIRQRELYGISYYSILGNENIEALGPVIACLARK